MKNTKVQQFQGDICNFDQMCYAVKVSGATSVIHCAGFGLSGTTNLPAYDAMTQTVNVVGTEAVVKACLANNVTNLVLTRCRC